VRAELSRGRALLAAAEGRHEEVEADLGAAVETLGRLGYPYHLALAQLDLAEWLIGQSRAAEAASLLADAIATFTTLGTTPALRRAQSLLAPTSADRPLEV
jgi:hypothetical protein